MSETFPQLENTDAWYRLKKLVDTLDWPPIGTDAVPLEQQIEQVKLIRRAALAHATLVAETSNLYREREALLGRIEQLKLAVADALRTLQMVSLADEPPVMVVVQ